MMKILSRLSLVGIVALLCGIFAGCDENGKGESFSVNVKDVGPGYVDLIFTAPAPLEVAYLLDTKEKLMNNPTVLFKSGKVITVTPDEVVRITNGIDEQTQYYLYIVARLDTQDYSEILTVPFKTTEYDLDELLTVVDRSYDGYQMRITIPEETKERGNAIRYSQCCLLQYNYSRSTSNDDYFSLLYNGGAWCTTKDMTASFNEDLNWYQTGQDADADGIEDWANYWNSISPGEPVVFIAGEFGWMEDTPDYEGFGFSYPSGWPAGYYLPMLDPSYYGPLPGAGEGDDEEESSNEQSSMGVVTDWNLDHPLDDYWTGAFQRKIFHTKEPAVLDAGVDIQIVEVTPVEAVIKFVPDEDVYQYCVGVFDAATYNELLKLLTLEDGTILEDYLQWAVTSYFSAYVFGTFAGEGEMTVKISDMFYVSNLPEQETMYVMVTAMGDQYGSTQSFQTKSFQLKPKVLPKPKIKVTADPENSTPYVAAFNIRCEDYDKVPVTSAYYAANYERDWKLAINGGSTYSGLVLSNAAVGYFSEDELYGYEVKNKDGSTTYYPGINSEEGLSIKVPSIDGETTRIVVLGYNDELTPNDIDSYDFIEECPASASFKTPYADINDNYIVPAKYNDLAGKWTITAELQSGSDKNDTFYHTSDVTISDNLYDYPETLTDEVYETYKKAGKEKDVVDGWYNEFKELADEITEERLENQNRLVCMGWLDKAQYGRLDLYTPYDLFVSPNYNSIDVSSIYNDYGPKWYIEAYENEDGTISYKVPFDANFLPPTLSWSVPFYLCAMEIDNYYTIMYADEGDPKNLLSFPVEVSEDRNTIAIKPFVYENTTYYPNVIGLDSTFGTLLDYPVISEVVLERVVGGASAAKAPAAMSASGNGPGRTQVNAHFPAVYKARTAFDPEGASGKVVERKHVSIEKVHENAERYFENLQSLSSRK